MARPSAPSLQPSIFTTVRSGDYRKDDIFSSPFQFAGFGGLSETISIIELSIWWFIYDKGVITQ